MKRILFAAAASLVLTMAISTTPSFAKKVSNHTASGLMSICLLDNGRISEPNNGLYVKCCTRKGGYCIICKQNGSGLCNKTSYLVRDNLSRPAAIAPGVMAPDKSRGGRVNPTTTFSN
jgi:hypothetical protein